MRRAHLSAMRLLIVVAGNTLARPVILRRRVRSRTMRAGRIPAKAAGTRLAILNLVITRVRPLRRTIAIARRLRRITVLRLRRNTKQRRRLHPTAVAAGAVIRAAVIPAVVADTTADKSSL